LQGGSSNLGRFKWSFGELFHGPIEKENVGHIIKENDGCGM